MYMSIVFCAIVQYTSASFNKCVNSLDCMEAHCYHLAALPHPVRENERARKRTESARKRQQKGEKTQKQI